MMLFLTVFCFNLLSPLHAQDGRSIYISTNNSSSDVNSTTSNITRCRGSLLFNFTEINNFRKVHVNLHGINLPEKFDARQKWSNCKSIKRIRNQGSCGGCWAYASVSVMEDRLCIASHQGTSNLAVSIEELLKCCRVCMGQQSNETDIKKTIDGCKRGSVSGAFHYWTSEGLLTGIPEDKNFIANETQLIEERCVPQRNIILPKHVYTKTWGVIWYQFKSKSKDTINQLKADIFFNGPVVAFFESYEYIEELKGDSLLTFDKNLVKEGEQPILHAVKVIGWSFKNRTPVWIIANSWGTEWCDAGFCYIPQGINALKVEEFGMVGSIPSYTSLNYHIQGRRSYYASRNDGNMISNFTAFFIFGVVFRFVS